MDFFIEEAVIKKNRTFDEIIYYFSWLVIVVCGFYAVMVFSTLTRIIAEGQWLALIPGVVAGAMAVFVFFYHDQLRMEYEYTFTNGSLDFARVFNNKRRKSLGSLNVRTVDAFGPVTGSAFKRLSSMQGVRIDRWFLNREANLYFFYFQKSGNKRMIVLEPSEEMVKAIRHFLAYGVYQE
jgi:hypothetical protein